MQLQLIINNIILLMERLELKELEKLKELKRQKQSKQIEVVKKMLEDDSVKTIFNYCKKILLQPLQESLSDYSPWHISKFIFDEQLQKSKKIFETFPDHECTIQQFLLLMMNTMKFPFEKWPYYLVGVKDMFNQIAAEKAETINFQNFFKYVIGEVLDFKQQQQNTEFQVRFQQLKKQDYLLHDNGVKKFYYSTDTKYFMTLDQSSPVIKLYNKQMRLVNKFTPNKQKHNKKYPNILHFDYNEMSSRLGIVLSDSTFSIINFYSFLNKSKYEFDLNGSNEVVIGFEDKMLQVYYIQMINKWALISDMNRLYTFDYQKYKQSDPHYFTQIKLENQDLKITYILQLVNLSMICVVAGNQVYFFNQNFCQTKHSKFAHGTNIKNFRYCEQMGIFMLCGDEKFITFVTLIKNSDSFQISTFDTQSKYQICTFEIFPSVGTIVAVDKNNEVRLFDISQGSCYQVANYSNIVKKQHGQIKMFKISRTEFALYETYTLVFHQQKIAIQKDTEFAFLPRTYYDEAKQEFYLSVNNQIISFSLFQGEIRKSFNLQTANVPKHESFILGKETNLFIIDSQKNIYEAYLKDQLPDGQNKNYKKKIGVSRVVEMFYDQDTSHAFIVGPQTIHTIRNDGLNNFTVTSVLNIQNYPQIIKAIYNSHQKYILALTINQEWLVIDAQTYKLLGYYSYVFPIDPNEHEDIIVQNFEQDENYDLDILLNNRNQIYLLSRSNNSKYVIKIQDYLPYKQKGLQFVNLKYCQVRNNKRYLLLSDKTGYLLELNISQVVSKKLKQTQKQRMEFKFPAKDLHKLQNTGEKADKVYISGAKPFNLDKKDVTLFKGHEKQIKILSKVNLQGIKTLTISTDGHLKIWQGQSLLFHLKLPDLKKIEWNMDSIQKIKNERSVNELVKVLNKICQFTAQKTSPQNLLNKNLQLKLSQQNKQVKKFNINQPIQIQIDNKDLEQFVYKTQNINWYNYKPESKKIDKDLAKTERGLNHHPWRTRHEFRKIMQKASPQNKYKKKMPLDLINLRNSLDMKDRASRLNKEYQGQLVILPQLNTYVLQNRNNSVKQKQQNQTEQNENQQAFESCLYVKKKKQRKKINQFDEIDKQFKKKWLALTAKKYIPKSQGKKKQDGQLSARVGKQKINMQKSLGLTTTNIQTKYDPIEQVRSIFENHNRQASINKKGRMIRIPEIKLRRQDLFNND